MKDFVKLGQEVGEGLEALGAAAPETMNGFGALMEASLSAGALSQETKELIALAIAVSLRCDGCIAHHAHAVLEAGATREQVAETIGVAILMGGGPAVVYGIEALAAYDQFTQAAT